MKVGFGIKKRFIFVLVFSLLAVVVGGFSTAQAVPENPKEEGTGLKGDQTRGGLIEIAPFGLSGPEVVANSEGLGDPEPIRDPDEHRKLLAEFGYPFDPARGNPVDGESFFVGELAAEIIPPPDNDDISAATNVPAPLPYSDVVITSEATVEGGEPDWYCGVSVGATVWYRYTPTGNGFFMIDTFGSDFDTVLLVLLDGSMTPVGCNDQAEGTDQSKLLLDGDSGITYLIGVGGWIGDTGSMQINMRNLEVFSSCSTVVDVTEAECLALRNLYLTTGGESWFRSGGWLETNEVCTWEGIYCDSGAVVILSLYSNNLAGTLSTDLTGLGSLEVLDLGDNSLSGNLTAIGGNLPSNITFLIMYMNNFFGTLPVQLLSFPNLWVIDLEFNSLSGNFSTAMESVPTSVAFLDLHMNDFTGTIPDLTSYGNLISLTLGYNQLVGDIALVFDNLPSGIESLYLEYNDFTGTIPASAGSLAFLEALNLTANQLTGDLGALMANLPTSIRYLQLGFNDFYGTIPTSVSSLVNLFELHIPFNDELIGTIPLSITGLGLQHFSFEGTYLCEPADASYITWKGTVFMYFPGYCGTISQDFTIEHIAFWPSVPLPGEGFEIIVFLRNVGGELSDPVWTDVYIDRYPGSPADFGDYRMWTGPLEPGGRATLFFVATGLADGSHGVAAYVDLVDDAVEDNESNNSYGAITLKVSTSFFESYFEAGTFDEWSRFNDGNGFLYPCTSGALHGTWGACVERGSNDKRKQLIDETPVSQTVFNVQFGFDVNSLSMGIGERFRFMQVKMGPERPFFIVMRYQGGQYQIQLNALLDDLTKVKTSWYQLSDAPHVIEVGWEAASGPAADNGSITLYIDDLSMEVLSGLDNDTLYVDSYKTGFTSKLVGKTISGIFYLDDIVTSRSGYIGLP